MRKKHVKHLRYVTVGPIYIYGKICQAEPLGGLAAARPIKCVNTISISEQPLN